LRDAVGSPLAKVAVFTVSGMGHTYAMNCTRQPIWMQAAMMSCFLIQLPLLAIEESFGFEGPIWLRACILIASPLFVEPLLATLGW